MRPSLSLDLEVCNTPEDVVRTLRAAAETYLRDAGDMDATAFLDGRHWVIIARELERTADRIVSKVSKAGYPFTKANP